MHQGVAGTAPSSAQPATRTGIPASADEALIRLFLCGDIMTGRGVDQILPTPSAPRLFEPLVRSAVEYVELAEKVSGPLPRKVGRDYLWGAALSILAGFQPHARIVNLETAVTRCDRAWPDKQIHYRMHPDNVECLCAANIDCCVLSNNHVLDWGRGGLQETLQTLHRAGIATTGAGGDAEAAAAPAILTLAGRARVLVYGVAVASSGVPADWGATQERSGVNWLQSATARSAERIARQTALERRARDCVVVSIHWGGNWGYDVSRQERAFAHRLIDLGAADVIHGHSSHHPKGLEVYRDKLIVYGCGDWLNDYEGIRGYESFRPDTTLMYFPVLDSATGTLRRLTLVPTRIHRFQVARARGEDARWLCDTLDRESRRWGTRVRPAQDGQLVVEW